MMPTYDAFLATKMAYAASEGLASYTLPDRLFPFQRHVTGWALERGRAAPGHRERTPRPPAPIMPDEPRRGVRRDALATLARRGVVYTSARRDTNARAGRSERPPQWHLPGLRHLAPAVRVRALSPVPRAPPEPRRGRPRQSGPRAAGCPGDLLRLVGTAQRPAPGWGSRTGVDVPNVRKAAKEPQCLTP